MYIPEVTCPHCHSTQTEAINLAGNDTGEYLCSNCAHIFPLFEGITTDVAISAEEIEAAQESFNEEFQAASYDLLFAELDYQSSLSAKQKVCA